MQAGFEKAVYAFWGALVFPGIGAAELLVALLVALAFAYSALRTLLLRGKSNEDWREGRF